MSNESGGFWGSDSADVGTEEHINSASFSNDLLCPIEAIDSTLALAPKDWSIDKNDAWIYGIVAGWDDDSLNELKARFRWSDETVLRLKELHEACNKLRA
jgi:hypothetical protein